MSNVTNEQVKCAGFYYIGHFGVGELRIDFSACRIVIRNQRKIYDLLYNIFEVDPENGVYFEDIKGKYCRLICDDKFKVIGIQHIIRDYCIDIEELNK